MIRCSFRQRVSQKEPPGISGISGYFLHLQKCAAPSSVKLCFSGRTIEGEIGQCKRQSAHPIAFVTGIYASKWTNYGYANGSCCFSVVANWNFLSWSRFLWESVRLTVFFFRRRILMQSCVCQSERPRASIVFLTCMSKRVNICINITLSVSLHSAKITK